MNLPGFRKGDVLLAEDLQGLSDAVMQRRAAVGAVRGGRGPAVWQQGLRTPIRESGDGRVAVGFDLPVGCECVLGRPLVTGLGYRQGAATEIWMQRGGCAAVPCDTADGWVGAVYQSLQVRNDGTALNITEPFVEQRPPCHCHDCYDALCARPMPQRWWGDDGQADGTEGDGVNLCGGGMLTVLVGCMRRNGCSAELCGGGVSREVGLYYRRHWQHEIPHVAVNAKAESGERLVTHDVKENVSRVKRLAAGVGVQLADEGDVVRIAADGGGLRPVNPPGAVDCACEEDAGDAVGCACEVAVRRAVPLVGEEWPAGAPVGVIVRQLVGRAGAVVRRHVPQEGEACCEFRCSVDVVARVPVNAGDAAGSCAVAGVGFVTCEGYHTCCVVPLRRLQAGDGLQVTETDLAVRAAADLAVVDCSAGEWGDLAMDGVCGWVLGLEAMKEVPVEGYWCGVVTDEGSVRQLMRFNGGQLQVVQQVKRDGIWQGMPA